MPWGKVARSCGGVNEVSFPRNAKGRNDPWTVIEKQQPLIARRIMPRGPHLLLDLNESGP
jgi:hypothetical protein